MLRTIRSRCLPALVVVALPAWLPAQDETSPPPKSPSAKDRPVSSAKDPQPKKERLFAIGAFGGKVLRVEEEGKSFLLRVYGQTPVVKMMPGRPAAGC